MMDEVKHLHVPYYKSLKVDNMLAFALSQG